MAHGHCRADEVTVLASQGRGAPIINVGEEFNVPLTGRHLRTIALQGQGLTTGYDAEVMAQLSVPGSPLFWAPSAPGKARRKSMATNKDGESGKAQRPDTRVITAGRDPAAYHGFVNPPVYHASTVLRSTAASSATRALPIRAARHADYGGARTRRTGYRGAAMRRRIAIALGAGGDFGGPAVGRHAGDHILVTDSAYGPTRIFCDQILTRLGVTTTYYDPAHRRRDRGADSANTRAVFVESPGWLSSRSGRACDRRGPHARGAVVLMDNTWATPLYFRALDFGVDLSIHAGKKSFRRTFRT